MNLTDTIDQIQHDYGFDTRTALHNKTLDLTGEDEARVDAAVFAYCQAENEKDAPRYHELTFKDVPL